MSEKRDYRGFSTHIIGDLLAMPKQEQPLEVKGDNTGGVRLARKFAKS
jgi:hypothetical protein